MLFDAYESATFFAKDHPILAIVFLTVVLYFGAPIIQVVAPLIGQFIAWVRTFAKPLEAKTAAAISSATSSIQATAGDPLPALHNLTDWAVKKGTADDLTKVTALFSIVQAKAAKKEPQS